MSYALTSRLKTTIHYLFSGFFFASLGGIFFIET